MSNDRFDLVVLGAGTGGYIAAIRAAQLGMSVALVERELAHDRLTALHVVETMHQRKALMADLADGFAALPGGYGTLDETFEILTWAQIGLHAKPVGVFNVDGFFDLLLAWIRHAVAEGFLRQEHLDWFHVASRPEELLGLLARPEPARPLPKWIAPEDR